MLKRVGFVSAACLLAAVSVLCLSADRASADETAPIQNAVYQTADNDSGASIQLVQRGGGRGWGGGYRGGWGGGYRGGYGGGWGGGYRGGWGGGYGGYYRGGYGGWGGYGYARPYYGGGYYGGYYPSYGYGGGYYGGGYCY